MAARWQLNEWISKYLHWIWLIERSIDDLQEKIPPGFRRKLTEESGKHKKKNSTGWGCAIGFFLFSTSCGGIDSWKNVSFPARFELEGRHGTAVTSGGGRDLSLWKKKLMMMTVSCYRTSRRGIFGILFFFPFPHSASFVNHLNIQILCKWDSIWFEMIGLVSGCRWRSV